MDWGFNIPEDYELPDEHVSFTDDEKFFLIAAGIGKAMQLKGKDNEKVAYEIVKQALMFLRQEVKPEHLQKAKDISKSKALQCGCKVCQELLKWIEKMAEKREAKARQKVDVIDPFSDKFE